MKLEALSGRRAAIDRLDGFYLGRNGVLSLALMAVLLSLVPGFVFAKQPPNVLLVCVDDLRPELNSFGRSYVNSPNMDRLAAEGRSFSRHYVQAPTCGASRYTLLTGRYGPGRNDALFRRAKLVLRDPAAISPSLPAWFRQHGYETVSIGKVSHHPGGRGGSDWNDPNVLEMPNSWDQHLMPTGAWQHPRGAMHGLAHGEIRADAADMDVFQSAIGPDTIYPDGLIAEEAVRQLRRLAKGPANSPFFLAVGFIRPHLPFGAPSKYLDAYQGAKLPLIEHPDKPLGRTTWHRSGEFMKYRRWGRDPNLDAEFADQVRRHYAACVSYSDAQIGRVLQELQDLNLRKDTIVVLWGDHGWHLGEHAIWGKHSLFEESLRSPLIICYDGIPMPGKGTDSMVETLDIFPTLCDLAGVPTPDTIHGVSLQGILQNPQSPGHHAISYQGNGSRTLRTARHRLIVHADNFAELYDHSSPAKETENIADTEPKVRQELLAELNERLPKVPAVLDSP